MSRNDDGKCVNLRIWCTGLNLRIKELEERNKKLTALNERLLDHITQQAAYGDEVQQLQYLAWLEKEEGK